ncbi:MAG: STM4012 family radical SAM protein [bacterium]
MFTMAKPKLEFEQSYMDVLERQARLTRAALPDAKFARLAIGGGTPTHLMRLTLCAPFAVVNRTMGADARTIPTSVEMSPETLTPEKIRLPARAWHRPRQHRYPELCRGRNTRGSVPPQDPKVAHRALDMMRSADFAAMNIDLIYGIEGQTPDTFAHSIHQALKFSPEEIYLYPLYVRPLTGLGNSPRAWEDMRFALYLRGRDELLDAGYEQVSMRMFRRPGEGVDGPIYCCQSDGMVGLGAGARSYTSDLHYCTDYAVGRRGVVSILEDFVARSDAQLAQIDYGMRLNTEEQRRRFVILSILSHEGLSDADYAARFKAQPMDDFPELVELVAANLATKTNSVLRLTSEGVGWSDAIGPWLYSATVRDACQEFELR